MGGAGCGCACGCERIEIGEFRGGGGGCGHALKRAAPSVGDRWGWGCVAGMLSA